MPDPPRRPLPGIPTGRLPAREEGPVLPPRQVERPALPPEPGSSPEAVPVPPQRPVRVERGPESGRHGSTYARAAVSLVDRLLSHGGRSVALILSLAALAYVSPPAITAAGGQATAMVREWRQPDMARKLTEAIAKIDSVVETVRRDAEQVGRDRVAMEDLVSTATKRFDQGRDDDRAAIQVAFQQIDQMADVVSRAQLPIALHDSWPTGVLSTEPPPAQSRDRRPRVAKAFPPRPDGYARRP